MLCVVTGEARQEGTKGSDSVYLNVDGDCEQRIVFKKVGVPSGKLLVVHSVADGRTTVDGWCGSRSPDTGVACSAQHVLLLLHLLLCTVVQRWCGFVRRQRYIGNSVAVVTLTAI